MNQSTRRATTALLLSLTLELMLAAWWRWPWTIAAIEMPFDYGSGHVAVVSEHWRRAGALRQHFLPVMSIDRELPEWPYRTLFSQEYSSVPPLAFIIHYAATRLLPRTEPVLLAKLLAQTLTAVSVLMAAALLAGVFDAWAIVVAFSFLISGVPFLLWFANGYFAVNVGLAVQLVLVAWCAHVVARSLAAPNAATVPGSGHVVFGGLLAFLGAFADYMPFVANATAFAGLMVLGFAPGSSGAARRFGRRAAGALAVGSLAALLTTVTLYARQMGLARYRQAIVQRVADRTGEAPFAVHLDVIRRQLLRAWPAPLLIVLGAAAAAAVVWSIAAIAGGRAGPARRQAFVVTFAMAVALLPSLAFHYRAVNYVSIHWWFSGTWTIALTVGVLACVDLVRRTRRSSGSAVACLALAAAVVAANVRFTAAQAVVEPTRSDRVRLYRDVGRALPPDGWPLVVADVEQERPGLFEDFPYPTAYLRRPVLLRERTGTIRLPKLYDELYEGRPLDMGGEDVRERLRIRGGEVYVAYDPDARECRGTRVPISTSSPAIAIAVCRAPANVLVDNPASVLGPLNPDYFCKAPAAPPAALRLVSNRRAAVSIAWAESATKRTSYILEVGRAAGASDALVAPLGRATEFTARDVVPGTYFVRVRGQNACGAGQPSNELAISVE